VRRLPRLHAIAPPHADSTDGIHQARMQNLRATSAGSENLQYRPSSRPCACPKPSIDIPSIPFCPGRRREVLSRFSNLQVTIFLLCAESPRGEPVDFRSVRRKEHILLHALNRAGVLVYIRIVVHGGVPRQQVRRRSGLVALGKLGFAEPLRAARVPPAGRPRLRDALIASPASACTPSSLSVIAKQIIRSGITSSGRAGIHRSFFGRHRILASRR